MHTTDNKIIASDLNFGNIYSKCPILSPKPLDNSAPDLFARLGFTQLKCPLLSPKPLDSSAPDLFARLGFTQLIDRPTRVTNDTSALIDLLFVQNEDLVTQFGTLPKIADHDGILVCLDAKREKITNKTKTIFDYKNANTEGLITFIKNYNFEEHVFSHEVLHQTELYSKVLIKAFEQFVPKITLCVKPHTPAWCNTYTRMLLRKKSQKLYII